MLPPPPLTDPDVQISRVRFFTGELRSQQCSDGQCVVPVEGAVQELSEPIPWESAAPSRQPLPPDPCSLMGVPERERFTFLGYSFGPHHPYKPSARMYLYMSASPSKKSVQRLKIKVSELLVPSNVDPWH
jgi:hypothetical protein